MDPLDLVLLEDDRRNWLAKWGARYLLNSMVDPSPDPSP